MDTGPRELDEFIAEIKKITGEFEIDFPADATAEVARASFVITPELINFLESGSSRDPAFECLAELYRACACASASHATIFCQNLWVYDRETTQYLEEVLRVSESSFLS